MSILCSADKPRKDCNAREIHGLDECPYAHSVPNESPSSPRTRGSSTAARAKELEGTVSQLAPVLRPLPISDQPGGVCPYCGHDIHSIGHLRSHKIFW